MTFQWVSSLSTLVWLATFPSSPSLSCHPSPSNNRREHLQLVHGMQDTSSKKGVHWLQIWIDSFPMYVSKGVGRKAGSVAELSEESPGGFLESWPSYNVIIAYRYCWPKNKNETMHTHTQRIVVWILSSISFKTQQCSIFFFLAWTQNNNIFPGKHMVCVGTWIQHIFTWK